MPDFNVCLVEPPGYPHSGCLLEVSELLAFSLQDLGYETTFMLNYVDPVARNVLVGCHLLEPQMTERFPDSTIVINSEQIYEKDPFNWNEKIFTWARRFETWDYSEKNIAAFQHFGMPEVKLLKIGHQDQLTRIPKSPEPDIDVLFYGSMTDRRKAVFKQIEDKGLNLVTLFGVYGADRDRYIGRSKIVLSMHNHDAEIFEVVRVHYLLSNAVAVVGETNSSTSIPDFYADAISGVPYEDIADECERLVRDDGARAALAQRGYDTIRRHPQTEFTKALLS